MKALFQTIAHVVLLTLVGALVVSGYACAVAACKGTTLPEPSYVETVTDGGDDIPTSDLPDGALRFPECAAACKVMRRSDIACPEAQKLDGGMSCYDVCAKAESSGHFTLNPKCIASKTTRDGVRSCKTVRCIVP